MNQADILVREGRFVEKDRQQPLPIILGVEGAGDIAAVGPGCDTHSVGDRVAVIPMLTCGTCEPCRKGLLSECADLRIVGEHVDGTCAQYMVLPARNAIKVPDGPGYEALSVSIVAYMTAWHMLKTRGDLTAGETLLIVGGGSGMGSAALQLARAIGARVIVTTGSDEKCRQLIEAGADAAVNYTRVRDWDVEVRRLTGGRGVDIVHDTVGGATFQKSINALRQRGRMVCMGSHSGRSAEVLLVSIHRNEVDIRGCHTAHMSEIDEFLPLLADGSLRPILDATFSLEQVREAHLRLASPERLGKIAISIG
ncbi:MAG: zinc-binding dehydrogenase [Rhodobacter sp.]|nr:zinc-binding dehydrogenase [Paracoccaceae bacterium]MCC0078151.1 zinc-binding dehydrogenase [Rhodobacter sp.]